jgi:NTE family protein
VQTLRKSDVRQLLDFAFSRAGIFSGDRIMQKLKDMLGDTQIEDLPISFTAVASDLDTGREVWLSGGSLFSAIRASMAIPTIFTPVTYEGHLLVDGGLLNPVPIAPTLKDVTDYTIAVSLSGREAVLSEPTLKSPKPKANSVTNNHTAIREFIESIQVRLEEKKDTINIFDVMSRSLESVAHVITRFKLAAYNPDFLLEIPKNACGVFEFYRAGEMIELGYQQAARELALLRP